MLYTEMLQALKGVSTKAPALEGVQAEYSLCAAFNHLC